MQKHAKTHKNQSILQKKSRLVPLVFWLMYQLVLKQFTCFSNDLVYIYFEGTENFLNINQFFRSQYLLNEDDRDCVELNKLRRPKRSITKIELHWNHPGIKLRGKAGQEGLRSDAKKVIWNEVTIHGLR